MLISFFAMAHEALSQDTEKDIVFIAGHDNTEQRYVLWTPAGLTDIKGRDLFIALHGHGSDRWQFIQNPRDECRAVRDIARKNNAPIISPDYRAKTSWMGPAAEADLLQIIADYRKNNKPTHVFLVGGSMGATSALTFAALHPEMVDGVVAMNAIANHLDYTGFQDAISASFGGDKETKPEEYRKRSGELWPERFTMPIAFTIGGADEITPPQSVRRLAEKLRGLGRPPLLIERQNGGHETNYEDAFTAIEYVLANIATKR
jgi:pimeloyl-ACP methyl ester carboxylesterase